MTVRSTVIITCLAACDLGPRVDDPMVTADAPKALAALTRLAEGREG